MKFLQRACYAFLCAVSVSVAIGCSDNARSGGIGIPSATNPQALTQSRQDILNAPALCSDGSQPGPDGLCANGEPPAFPPVQATQPPCFDDCLYPPCQYYCEGQPYYGPPQNPNPNPPHPTATPKGHPNYPGMIYNAAMNFKGKSTRGLKGAQKGSECVAAMQQILENAGLANIDNETLHVWTFAQSLTTSGYTQVSQGDAVPGDIAVLTDKTADPGTHIGVCETGGCGTMISNASSAGTFSWEDTPANENALAAAADNNSPPGPIYFYHHI